MKYHCWYQVFSKIPRHIFNVDTTLELLFYLENIGLSKHRGNGKPHGRYAEAG